MYPIEKPSTITNFDKAIPLCGIAMGFGIIIRKGEALFNDNFRELPTYEKPSA